MANDRRGFEDTPQIAVMLTVDQAAALTAFIAAMLEDEGRPDPDGQLTAVYKAVTRSIAHCCGMSVRDVRRRLLEARIEARRRRCRR